MARIRCATGSSAGSAGSLPASWAPLVAGTSAATSEASGGHSNITEKRGNGQSGRGPGRFGHGPHREGPTWSLPGWPSRSPISATRQRVFLKLHRLLAALLCGLPRQSAPSPDADHLLPEAAAFRTPATAAAAAAAVPISPMGMRWPAVNLSVRQVAHEVARAVGEQLNMGRMGSVLKSYYFF